MRNPFVGGLWRTLNLVCPEHVTEHERLIVEDELQLAHLLKLLNLDTDLLLGLPFGCLSWRFTGVDVAARADDLAFAVATCLFEQQYLAIYDWVAENALFHLLKALLVFT